MEKNQLLYGLLALTNAIVTQAAIELGAGHIPLPEQWRWIVPIVSAGLVALSSLLPRVGTTRTLETITAVREVPGKPPAVTTVTTERTTGKQDEPAP